MADTLTFNQLMELVKLDLESGNTPALLGEPGIGKSSFFEGLSRELKTEVFTLPVNQLADRADLTGGRILQVEHNGNTEYEQAFFPHATIMQAIRYAKDHPDENPILFLDEINRASADITSSILAFITLRRIGTIEFPKNLQFAIAGNDKGNVVALDGASLSRFAIYRVIPDLETFLAVQEVNPFIVDVLTKNPDLLMADPVEPVGITGSDQDDDEDDDVLNDDFLSGFDTSGSDFSQLTRPRTISRLSQWLNKAGINKSGNDKEKERLQALFTETATNKNGPAGDLMFVAIESKVGYTEFALKLHETLHDYFTSMINSSNAGANTRKVYTQPVRPNQTTINTLSRAQTADQVDELISSQTPEEQANTMIWLFETASTTELNNNATAVTYVSLVANNISELNKDQARVFTELLNAPDSLNTNTLNEFRKSQSPALGMWNPMMQVLLG